MIQTDIQQIKDLYNADNDVIPGTPRVTWTDRQLLDMIEILLDRIESLESADDSIAATVRRNADARAYS